MPGLLGKSQLHPCTLWLWFRSSWLSLPGDLPEAVHRVRVEEVPVSELPAPVTGKSISASPRACFRAHREAPCTICSVIQVGSQEEASRTQQWAHSHI